MPADELAWSPRLPEEPGPEEELESAIWAAMTSHGVICADSLKFIDALVQAARSYAAKDSDELTRRRRDVLHRDAAPLAHSSDSDCGGSGRTGATERPLAGSSAHGAAVPGGGATLSTGASIPGPVTSDDTRR